MLNTADQITSQTSRRARRRAKLSLARARRRHARIVIATAADYDVLELWPRHTSGWL